MLIVRAKPLRCSNHLYSVKSKFTLLFSPYYVRVLEIWRKGQVIEKALFLDIKKYGYYIQDKVGNKKVSSVFSGIQRNSLTFEEIINVFNGQVLTKVVPIRFFKSFQDLSITITSTKVSIINNPLKKRINNLYPYLCDGDR